MLTCSKCRLDLPPSAFSKGRKDCRACANRRLTAYRDTPRGRALQREYASRYHATPRGRYSILCWNARKRGIAVGISFEQYLGLVSGACNYCGGSLPVRGCGVDRVDSRLPYLIDNCVPSCGVCNRIKGAVFTHDEMRQIGVVLATIRQARKRDVA